MTKTELRIKQKLLLSLYKHSQELEEILKEIEKEISESSDDGEISRLRVRYEEISDTMKNVDAKCEALDKWPTLYSVCVKK